MSRISPLRSHGPLALGAACCIPTPPSRKPYKHTHTHNKQNVLDRYMCVTLWQDFIGSAFLASLAPPAAAAAADTHPGGGGGDRCWALDLHSAAATSKPSPYLPMCMVAVKPGPDGAEEEEAGESGRSTTDCEGIRGGAARVAAWCDRAGRPLAPGGEPVVLTGEKEVRIVP